MGCLDHPSVPDPSHCGTVRQTSHHTAMAYPLSSAVNASASILIQKWSKWEEERRIEEMCSSSCG